jgi:hypothetical protein
MPCGEEMLDIEFDFVSHCLCFRMSNGETLTTPLRPQTVADFYAEYQRSLATLGVTVKIHPVPVEVPDPIPFAEDTKHASYDADAAHRVWRVLAHADQLFHRFGTGFLGKISPVHFFWGSFDLAVTRFSGRKAPPRPGADAIQREAYSHEVISAGFWPGNGGFGAAAFYCYAAPVPEGLDTDKVQPAAAYYDKTLGEFLLKYDDLLREPSPDDALMTFLQTSYAAAANRAHWDRDALERH